MVGKELGGLGQDGGGSGQDGAAWVKMAKLGSRWLQLVLGRSWWGRNSGDWVKMAAARPGEELVGKELGASGQDGGGSGQDGGGSSWGGVGGEETREIGSRWRRLGSRWRRLVLGRSWWGRNSGDPVQMEAAHPGEESVGKELGRSGQDGGGSSRGGVGGEGTRGIGSRCRWGRNSQHPAVGWRANGTE